MKLTQKRVRLLMQRRRRKKSGSDFSSTAVVAPVNPAIELLTHDSGSSLDSGAMLSGDATLLPPLLDDLVTGQFESASHSGKRIKMLNSPLDGFVLGCHGLDEVGLPTDHSMQAPLVTQAFLAFPQECLASSILNMTINDRIRLLRNAAGLSLEALAATLGVSWQTIQQWEKGKTKPTIKRIQALADALKTTKEYLLFGDSPGARATPSHQEFETGNVSLPVHYSVDKTKFRPIPVIGRAQGGMPERIWTDGDYPVGATEQFAEVATSDPHAFLTPISGTSMVPRYNPGEYALVEPATEPDLEDDVLVRLTTGETMLKRLISRRGGVQLASYNEPGTMLYHEAEISWMFYVAHPVPARKIKTRL